MKQMLIINSQQALDKHVNTICDLWHETKWLRLEVDTDKQRSGQQRKAIEVYCKQLAEAFNDSGLDMRKVLAHRVDIPWSQASVKEQIWREVQKSQFEKQSSTKLTTQECSLVYETLSRFIAEKHNIYVPWPSKEAM